MKIEIYSDIHCPFCYLGKRRLELDLANMPGGDQVEILYRAYVLDPNAPKFSGKSVYQAQADRKGMPVEEIEAAYRNIAEQGKAYGLNYNMDAIIPTNTIDALALVQFAQESELQSTVMEKLYEAYYTDGENISDQEVLKRIATESGLDGSLVADVLNSGKYQQKVREDDAQIRQQKIEGIPYFIVNGTHKFFGSDQIAKVVEALRPKLQEIKPSSGMVCEGGICRMG
ncbi:MAG: DsbA family oxidoreductase [Turicibacter sp.]|nr:DsbA family oxidoreductase [Turicibacter sp.]